MSIASEPALELRLELTPEELQCVRSSSALGGLAIGDPITRTVRSIYFDTPDCRLKDLGISLSLKSDGDTWLQSVDGGILSEAKSNDLDRAVERPEPDLEVIGNRRVRRKIEKAVSRSILEPVFETVVQRTTRRLQAPQGELELVLNEGVLRAGSLQSHLCEAELDLKSGNPECLLRTATQLFASSPIRFAKHGTAERGYRLALGKNHLHAKPQRADLPNLSKRHTCSQALTLIMQSATEQILANRMAVLETEDPDAAHQLRIGLRRLRSALAAFRLMDDTPTSRELENHARSLARSVGGLRDADVLIEEIYAPVAGIMRGDPGLAPLRDALLAHRDQKRAQVRSELSGPQWSVLRLYLALWSRTLETDGEFGAPVAKFARAALKKRWRKVAQSGVRPDDLTVEQRHAMRKSLKTLRYTAEFFASLYSAGDTRTYVKQIRGLQEVFGYLNDVAAAERLSTICHDHCAGSREAQRAAGYVLGWHNAQAAQAWKNAHKGWHKLEALPRFWE